VPLVLRAAACPAALRKAKKHETCYTKNVYKAHLQEVCAGDERRLEAVQLMLRTNRHSAITAGGLVSKNSYIAWGVFFVSCCGVELRYSRISKKMVM
jgi:hypothetical protein